LRATSKLNNKPSIQVSAVSVCCLLLAVLCSAGCTITGAEREATKDLHWFGFRSHSDLDTDTRWQFAPDTRILISESTPAQRRDWLDSAQEGFYSVFSPPDTGYDLVLLVNWPMERRADPENESGWRLWPRTSDPLDLTLKLVSASNGRVVQNTQLRVDPSWFSPEARRPEQIETSFRRYAESLSAKR
jgi:hypothetical protein